VQGSRLTSCAQAGQPTMIKMHKESVRVAQSDPDTEKRLATLRNVFTGITEQVAARASTQEVDAAKAASRARAAQVRELHARAEKATEEGRRAPDRAFFARPYGQLDKSLWDAEDLRSWYSGGAASGALAGPDFGGATLGSTLQQAGYTMSAARALQPPPNPYRADAPAIARPEDAINASRVQAATTWRASASSVHWSDRESLLQLEKSTARHALGATGYNPASLQANQPYKSRPLEDDAWRFKPPHPVQHKEAMVSARAEAARPGVHNFTNSRIASQLSLSTERSNYF
jgi:hypothetical protein